MANSVEYRQKFRLVNNKIKRSGCALRKSRWWLLQRAVSDNIDWMAVDASRRHHAINFLTGLLERYPCKVTDGFFSVSIIVLRAKFASCPEGSLIGKYQSQRLLK